MKETNKKTGKQIHSAVKLHDLMSKGEIILYNRDRLGIVVFEVDIDDFVFSSVMRLIEQRRLYEVKK